MPPHQPGGFRGGKSPLGFTVHHGMHSNRHPKHQSDQLYCTIHTCPSTSIKIVQNNGFSRINLHTMIQVFPITHNITNYSLILSPNSFAFPFALQFCFVIWRSFLCNRHRLQLHWSLGWLPKGTIPRIPNPLAACLWTSPSTPVIVTTITCSFAWQSCSSIVPTCDDVTNVASVTLMCPLFHTQHQLTLAQPTCRALPCSMGATALHSNSGGHGWSAPTLVTPMVAQHILCTFHSTNDTKT